MDATAPVKVGDMVVRRLGAVTAPFASPWRSWNRGRVALEFRPPRGWSEARFGPPTWLDDTGHRLDGDCGWNLTLPCGLRVIAALLREPSHDSGYECVAVVPLALEMEHILRDLGVERDWITQDVRGQPRGEGPEWAALDSQESWAVWRQDDNGQVFVAGYAASEMDATCLALTFERRGHKQMYWTAER